MKKRLKGMVALILAMVMVMSVSPNVYGVISNEVYEEELLEEHPCMHIETKLLFDMEENFKDGKYYSPLSYGYSASEEESPSEIISDLYSYYYITGFTIWEVKEDGYIYKDTSDSIEVSSGYTVTASDIKKYGSVGSDGRVYYPVMVPKFGVKDFSLSVYDENGTKQYFEIPYNINSNDGTAVLYIPDEYIGYMLHSEHVYTETEEIYENGKVIDTVENTITKRSDVFISSYDDLVREMYLADEYGYKFTKLVLTKKMPYKVVGGEREYSALSGPSIDYVDKVVWLDEGEKVIKEQAAQDALVHYDYDENVEWTVWTVNFSGCTILFDENENYKDITSGFSVDDYSNMRTATQDSIYYYRENYPILYACVPEKIYNVPYYELDGTKGEDLSLQYSTRDMYFDCECTVLTNCDCDLSDEYYWCDCQSLKGVLKERYADKDCPEEWKFIYGDNEYVKVTSLSTIWDIAIADGNYDPTKAKLIPVCTNHDYDYDNGKVVINPTADEKGTTEYTCKKCGEKTRVQDVDKLISIDSVTLSNSTYTYNGTEFKPEVTVKAYVNSKLVTLTKNDYTVTYKNNKEVGIATVTVTGKGNYTGTLKYNFTIQPQKVTGLKQSSYATNSVTLKWDKVAGAKGYIIYLENTSTGKKKSVGESTTNSYTVKKLKAGSNYKYAVRAYGLVGNVRVNGGISDTKTMITKTAATKVSVTSNAKKKAVVTWKKVTGAEGYEVYMSTKRASGYKKIKTTKKNTVKYTKTGLTSKKTYYFKVRSYKRNASGEKVYSAFSSIKSVKIK